MQGGALPCTRQRRRSHSRPRPPSAAVSPWSQNRHRLPSTYHQYSIFYAIRTISKVLSRAVSSAANILFCVHSRPFVAKLLRDYAGPNHTPNVLFGIIVENNLFFRQNANLRLGGGTADAEDLKSSGEISPCGFDSHPGQLQ